MRKNAIALAVAVAVALLTGCDASRSAGALPSGSATGSWMLPQATQARSTLLYVSDSNAKSVWVYDYASGDLVGKLTGLNEPAGACVDATGDVYVTDGGSEATLEFAHGGTKPIHAYRAPASGVGCAVDRNGDLAVAAQPLSSDGAQLCVWKAGTGEPTCYTDRNCGTMESPGYDGRGNLFVEGVYFGSAVCELPAGGDDLVTVALNGKALNAGGSVIWDGKNVVLTDWHDGPKKRNTLLYRVKEAPSGGLTVIGVTTLRDSCNGEATQVTLPFVVGAKNTPVNDRRGQTVIGANYQCYPAPLDAWEYPAGGDPAKRRSLKYFPGGAVVSI
jgi:hypothetical protein